MSGASVICHPRRLTQRQPLTFALSPTHRSQGKEGLPTCARWWLRELEGEEHTESWWLVRPPPTAGDPHLHSGPGLPSSLPPAAERVSGVSHSDERGWVSEPRFLLMLRCQGLRSTQPGTRIGVKKRRQPQIPGRKSTYPRLRPERGLEPGRGGAPRGWRGCKSYSAPEFGVKVGSGGSPREAESEARSHCQAFTAMYPGVGASWAPPLPSGELSCAGRASSAGQVSRRFRR